MKEWQSGLKWMRPGWRWIVIGAIGLSVGCSDDSSSGRGDAGPSIPVQTPSSPTSPAPPTDSAQPPAPGPKTEPPEDLRSEEELVVAGRSVYMANCIACHNLDATKDGALGPPVAGSSMELIEARVLRSEYPEGYTPKRDTRVMVALRHLEPKLKELVVYLNSLE